MPRTIGFLVLWLGGSRLAAQRPSVVVHYPLRYIDLTLVADTTYGLQVLALPALETTRGRTGAAPDALIRLRFLSDSALDWLNRGAAAISRPAPGGPPDAVQWSPALNALGGGGAIAVGRNRKKGALDKPYWLAVTDSTPGWRVEIAAQEADSLLRLLLVLASQSRIDTAGAATPEQVDRPVRVREQPKPSWNDAMGRALVQFVVGTDGRAEPESFVVLMTSSPQLSSRAWDVIKASRFEPASKGGQAVRQLVQQVIVWKSM